MREILFRGKVIDSLNGESVIGAWADGSLVVSKDNWWEKNPSTVTEIICPNARREYYGEYSAYECYIVDPETVSEYTGMCDKNGAKIFEGDIVLIDAGTIPYEIKMIDFEWVCVNIHLPNIRYYRHRLENNPEKYEIVGNIYDGSDLLKEATND